MSDREILVDVVNPSTQIGNKQGWSVALTIFLEVAIVGAFVVASLMVTGVLPTPVSAMSSYMSIDIELPSPPPPAPQRTVPQPPSADPKAAPTEAPPDIKPEPPMDRDFDRRTGPDDGTITGVPDGGFKNILEPPPQPPPSPQAPVRVGGEIKPPVKTRDVRPQYPAIAQSARVQGIVIIEATIGLNGKVQDARVLRSIPLLDSAALEAVREWEFTPTLLNGVPVPVIMTVTVQFTLS